MPLCWKGSHPCLMAALSFALLFCSSCKSGAKEENPFVGSYSMGEKVRVGPFLYSAVEAQWLTKVGQDPEARIPKNRFLVLKLAVTNAGNSDEPIPILDVQDSKGQSTAEVMEGMSDVPEWFAPLLRTLKPIQTQQGSVVFDVPFGAYKLRVTDGAEVGKERFALIDIPIQIK
jgi:hypothetical protein